MDYAAAARNLVQQAAARADKILAWYPYSKVARGVLIRLICRMAVDAAIRELEDEAKRNQYKG